MKLQLIVICLLISSNLYTMDEDNKNHLQKALAYAQQKKQNAIVIFQCANIQETNNFGNQDLQELASIISSNQNLQKQLQVYCDAVGYHNVVILNPLDENNTSSINGKTTIYMIPRFDIPTNHNDGDLFSLRNDIDKLKEEQKEQIPFIIATTEKASENLRNYLKRQYTNDVLVFFPEKSDSFLPKPLVIVGSVVALLGLWYFWFR